MHYMADKNSKRVKVGLVLTYGILIIFTILAIYPLIWLVLNSFKTTTEFQLNKLGFPKNWVLINYKDAWVRGKFPTLVLNSVIYTGVTTLAVIILSFMASFAFAKISHKASKLLHGSFIIEIGRAHV